MPTIVIILILILILISRCRRGRVQHTPLMPDYALSYPTHWSRSREPVAYTDTLARHTLTNFFILLLLLLVVVVVVVVVVCQCIRRSINL